MNRARSNASLLMLAAAALAAGTPAVALMPDGVTHSRSRRDPTPRKITDADRERLAAAEAKRARKAEKRKGGVL